jgi:hypothetical protein
MSHKHFANIFVIDHHAKFHALNCNGSLVISIKHEAIYISCYSKDAITWFILKTLICTYMKLLQINYTHLIIHSGQTSCLTKLNVVFYPFKQ